MEISKQTPVDDFYVKIPLEFEYATILGVLSKLGYTIEKVTLKMYYMNPYEDVERYRNEQYHIAFKGERPNIPEDGSNNAKIESITHFIVTNVFSRLLSESLVTNMINTLG